MTTQTDTIVGLGARGDYVAQVPNADAGRLRLTAEEAALFASVGRAARIDEVIERSGLSEPKAIAVLLSLRAKGAIVPARVNRPSGPVAPLDAAMAEQVDLDDARKREILDTEASLRGNHYEVLGLAPGASLEQVKQAFYEMSRKYHPDRFYNKNLGSFRSRVERIFVRLSEADRVLSDDDRRAAYFKEHPELARRAPAPEPRRPRTAEDDERDAERRARFARHPYLARSSRLNELIARAKQHLAQSEFGMAYSDLNIAAQVDPKNPEVQELLAQVREKQNQVRAAAELKRGEEAEATMDLATAASAYRSAANIDHSNARAAFKAAQSMLQQGKDLKEVRVLAQRAADLDPKKADHHALYGTVLLEMGMKKLAQKHLDQALSLDPNNAEAKRHMKKGRWPF